MLCDVIMYLDTWRIVLSWGKEPTDLDSYLVLPDPSHTHVNYDNREVISRSGKITLDTDSRKKYGHETITSMYCIIIDISIWITKKTFFNFIL